MPSHGTSRWRVRLDQAYLGDLNLSPSITNVGVLTCAGITDDTNGIGFGGNVRGRLECLSVERVGAEFQVAPERGRLFRRISPLRFIDLSFARQ